MNSYTVKPGNTFTSIAQDFNVKNGHLLRLHHNLNCPMEDVMYGNPIVGKSIIIPQEEIQTFSSKEEYEEYLNEEYDDCIEDFENEAINNEEDSQEEEDNDKNEESSKSEHDGKYFIIQKGTCQCNQGFKFPQFKVTSHQKHYWNSPESNSDYLAVTEDDLQFNPPAQPFGQCKLRPSSSGYLPCVYAPAGKWQKACDKIKVLDKKCLTEIAELMCATGGKITIKSHGQKSEIGKNNLENQNSDAQQMINPIIDFEEFKEEVNQDNIDYY